MVVIGDKKGSSVYLWINVKFNLLAEDQGHEVEPRSYVLSGQFHQWILWQVPDSKLSSLAFQPVYKKQT